MDLLQKIMERCKASITLEVNPHGDFYQTPSEYLLSSWPNEAVNQDLDTLEQIRLSDTLIILQVYPDTPVGFYLYIGNNLGEILFKCCQDLEIPVEEPIPMGSVEEEREKCKDLEYFTKNYVRVMGPGFIPIPIIPIDFEAAKERIRGIKNITAQFLDCPQVSGRLICSKGDMMEGTCDCRNMGLL